MQSKARKYKLNKEVHTNNFGRFIAALKRKSAIFCLFIACLEISRVLGKLKAPYFSFELLAFVPVRPSAAQDQL